MQIQRAFHEEHIQKGGGVAIRPSKRGRRGKLSQEMVRALRNARYGLRGVRVGEARHPEMQSGPPEGPAAAD